MSWVQGSTSNVLIFDLELWPATASPELVNTCKVGISPPTLTPLVAQTIKNPPAMQEPRVQSLDREDPLEEGMATHSSILAWRIPWTEKPWWATAHGVAKSRTRLSRLTL